MSVFSFLDSEIQAIKGQEIALFEDLDAGLKEIGPPTDHVLTKAKLLILIRSKKYKDAAELVSDRIAEVTWVDLAVYHSKWKSVFVRIAKNWREYILELSRSCEPWTRARIRTASATISRLIGPSVPLSDSSPPSESEVDKKTKKKVASKKSGGSKKKAKKKK